MICRMKTQKQLREIIAAYPFYKINAHIHTHLCDGAPTMTVENIAPEAERAGFELIVLTPHFHKQVSDGCMTLYHDTDENILLQLRDEIDFYKKHNGKINILLSTETDILTIDGDLSLAISKEVENALDFVAPTINYHPLLPLEMVAATDIKQVDRFHSSGRYRELIPKEFSADYILQTYYEAAINAITKCEYPSMLGHFFAPHSIADKEYTWFEVDEAYLPMMMDATDKLLRTCAGIQAVLDITGIHLMNGTTPTEQPLKDGFLYQFQRFTLEKCREYGIPFCPGSDAHNLPRIAECKLYKEIFADFI